MHGRRLCNLAFGSTARIVPDKVHNLPDSESHATLSPPGNQEDREVYLREHNAAKFIDAVHSAQAKQLDTVTTTMGAFAGEPEVPYVALDHTAPATSELTSPKAPESWFDLLPVARMQ